MTKNDQMENAGAGPLVWDDIRYFLALAGSGSLSGASRQLAVEHSTVSRRVGQLEKTLGVRLFDRLARGWTLTEEGRDLLLRAETVEQEVLTFRRAALGVDPLQGTVRISAPPLFLNHYVLPTLRSLRGEHPNLSLELIGERREADLVRAEADIALRLGQPVEPDLVMQSLGNISYGLYGVEALAGLAAQNRIFVSFDDSLPSLPQKQWLDEEAAGCRAVLRTNDLATMYQAALEGFGIALLPDFLGGQNTKLKKLSASQPDLSRPLFLVMHPDVRRSQRVRLVAGRLTKALRSALCNADR